MVVVSAVGAGADEEGCRLGCLVVGSSGSGSGNFAH